MTTNYQESLLVERSLLGDRRAYGEIVTRHQGRVMGVAYAVTADAAIAEEVAQDAFVEAWKSLRSLKDVQRLGAWLAGITRNLARRAHQTNRKHAGASIDAVGGDAAGCVVDAGDGPLDQVLCSEELVMIRRAIENIPEAHREVFALFYLQDQSVKQVAATLELSEVAVRKRLSRGRSLIKAELGRYVEDALGRLRPSRGFAAGVLALLPNLIPVDPTAASGSATGTTSTAKALGAGKYLLSAGAWKAAGSAVVASAAVAVIATGVASTGEDGGEEALVADAKVSPASAPALTPEAADVSRPDGARLPRLPSAPLPTLAAVALQPPSQPPSQPLAQPLALSALEPVTPTPARAAPARVSANAPAMAAPVAVAAPAAEVAAAPEVAAEPSRAISTQAESKPEKETAWRTSDAEPETESPRDAEPPPETEGVAPARLPHEEPEEPVERARRAEEAPAAKPGPKPKLESPDIDAFEDLHDASECEVSEDCSRGQSCRRSRCVEDVVHHPRIEEETAKLNWLSFSVSPDLMVLESTDDLCSYASQRASARTCVQSGDGTTYRGNPGVGSTDGNSQAGGLGTATARALLGYDRVVGDNFLLGGRLGFAFGGPASINERPVTRAQVSARAAYHFGNSPFASAGFRPFLFLAGGLAQATSQMEADLVDEEAGPMHLDVYKSTGLFFAGGGVGAQYAFTESVALSMQLGVQHMFPSSGTVISPSLGFEYGL